jgi:hypothetical protein
MDAVELGAFGFYFDFFAGSLQFDDFGVQMDARQLFAKTLFKRLYEVAIGAG